MVQLEDFGVEQFMDKYETGISYNMGETCCDSLSIEDVISLYEEGEKDHVRDELMKDLFNTKLVYGYIKGSEFLKNAISKVYNARSGNGDLVHKDDIVITNGAIGANFLLFYTLVNPGDKVIAVDPSYQQLTSVPNLFSANNLTKFELKYEDGYLPDMKKFKEMVQETEPKLVVINNPNNPTGALWDNSILEQFVEICKEYDAYFFCDEVYCPLFHSVKDQTKIPKSIVSFGYDKCISTGSMSKAFSLAGVRTGWIITKNKQLVKDLFSKRDYNTISLSMIDDKISTFVLKKFEKIIARNYKLCLENIELIDKFIKDSDGLIEWIRPEAGSTGFIKINVKGINTMVMCQELASQYKVLLVPGELFNNRSGFCRIGFGNSYNDLKGGLETFKLYLQDKKYWKSN